MLIFGVVYWALYYIFLLCELAETSFTFGFTLNLLLTFWSQKNASCDYIVNSITISVLLTALE